MDCVICRKKIYTDPNGWDGGHNASPVADGRCCADCNDSVVMTARYVEHGFTENRAKAMAASNRYNGVIGA